MQIRRLSTRILQRKRIHLTQRCPIPRVQRIFSSFIHRRHQHILAITTAHPRHAAYPTTPTPTTTANLNIQSRHPPHFHPTPRGVPRPQLRHVHPTPHTSHRQQPPLRRRNARRRILQREPSQPHPMRRRVQRINIQRCLPVLAPHHLPHIKHHHRRPHRHHHRQALGTHTPRHVHILLLAPRTKHRLHHTRHPQRIIIPLNLLQLPHKQLPILTPTRNNVGRQKLQRRYRRHVPLEQCPSLRVPMQHPYMTLLQTIRDERIIRRHRRTRVRLDVRTRHLGDDVRTQLGRRHRARELRGVEHRGCPRERIRVLVYRRITPIR